MFIDDCVGELDDICMACNDLTKYTCLKCKSFVCNRGIRRSIPASEEYPGWKSDTSVALCEACDEKVKISSDSLLQKKKKKKRFRNSHYPNSHAKQYKQAFMTEY